MDQDLVAFELVLTAKLASADVAEVRPLASVRLEVDCKLRLAFELFATEVAEQQAGALRLCSAVDVGDLLVVLQVIGPHVSFGAEVAVEGFHS